MRNTTKIWLITGALLMVSGLVLFVGAIAAHGWNFAGLSTARYETNTYEPDGIFDNIMIDVETTEIDFAPSGDGKCRIICYETEKMKHSAAVQNGTLTIKTVDTRKWYDHIGFFFEIPKMTVYLPQKIYVSLSIDTATGDITVPGSFSFQDLKIEGDTADIECLASVSNVMEMRSSTGNIAAEGLAAGAIRLFTNTGRIQVNSVFSQGKIDIETDTGTVRLTDVTCVDLTAESDTGTITLTNVLASGGILVENDTGNVKFDGSDAADISVRTSTGSVTGTLLSEKIFITETSTGRIDVPKTTAGGRCEIRTSTGNIMIETPIPFS